MQLDAAYKAYRAVHRRDFPQAVALYDGLLLTKGDRKDLWVNRGVALQAQGLFEEALKSFGEALKLDPDYAAGHINCGVVLGWMGRNEEALEHYEKALELEPDEYSALLGSSVILSSMGRYEEALQGPETVLKKDPGSGAAHYNRALTLLSMGHYEEGFREHEWRYGTEHVLGKHKFKKPMWLGEQTDRKILINCEQGLGDHLQFARYLPLVRDRGLNVIVRVPPSMKRLFAQFGVKTVVDNVEVPPFDLHCPIISLGAVFKTTLDTIPFTDSYLKADPEESQRWQHLRTLPGLKVGLCWYSGLRAEQIVAVIMHRRKSIPTEQIEQLLTIPGISWVSLQKDDPGYIPTLLHDPMPKVEDFADTAAIIDNLDLVITVDSAVAHLAGAMGKPVWVLNRADICWRWLSAGVESPWYQSARIYRQSRPMEWGDVMAQLKQHLEKEVQCDKRRLSLQQPVMEH